jgi:formylmethanofuran dehydrogenase subunit E
MQIVPVKKRNQKSGIGNAFQRRANPLRVERFPGPLKLPASLMKGFSSPLDSVIARSNCSRTIRPAGIPLRCEVSFSHSEISSVIRIVNVRLIRQECNTSTTEARPATLSDSRMNSLDEYLREAEIAHGHLCAGQVLGVRMAMAGLFRLGIEDPRGVDRKRLVTYVEIDRCATDAVVVVTGCRLGKRALKFVDWGKMAATFVDLQSGRAIRVAARESSKEAARRLHPEVESKNQQQMLAYREMPEEDLFEFQNVRVEVGPEDLPGYKGERIVCSKCGEGINFHREVVRDKQILCRGCAGENYYTRVPDSH